LPWWKRCLPITRRILWSSRSWRYEAGASEGTEKGTQKRGQIYFPACSGENA